MKSYKRIIPLGIVIIALVISTLYFEIFRYLGGSSSRIEGTGTIEVTEIELSSKIAGRINNLPFEEGATVKKGELIARLEYDELSAQRNSARANLVNAERNLKRISELYKTGSISKRDYDNAETVYRVAKANVELVSAGIDNAVIYSPIDGTILERNLELGEMAFPGSSILTIADLSKPWIKIYVSEKRLGCVKIKQRAVIKVDSYPNEEFTGEVVSISNKAEFTPKTIQTKEERVKLMYAVKIAVGNTKKKLNPGMPADVTLFTEDCK